MELKPQIIYNLNEKRDKMENKVLVEVSARHVHLSERDLAILFGEGYQLTVKKPLSQPGQYACEERVTVVGPKNTIKNVIILGPTRKDTQVEVSMTDARALGIVPIVRESGDIVGSTGCKIIGPLGEIELIEGVIVAKRHLHVAEADAPQLGVKDKEVIGIKLTTNGRSLIFDDVVVRVSPKFATAVHLDTDEANAAGFSEGFGEIVKF
jgi:putative phosphotransacetylase